MRRVFKDDAFQARFERDGYVTVQALDSRDLDELWNRYRRLPVVNDEGYFVPIFLDASHAEYKRAAVEAVADVFDRLIEKYLHDYRRLSGGFITKKPGRDSTVIAHQDWTFVDEREFASLNLWIPLIDTTEQNGALHVLRGGHTLGFTLRGPQIPSAYADVQTLVNCEDLDCLPVKAGEAVIYSHNLIHRSPPNVSDQPRVVAATGAIPSEAQLLHCRLDAATKKVKKYEPPLDFMERYTIGQAGPPDEATFLGDVDYVVPAVTREQLASLKRGTV